MAIGQIANGESGSSVRGKLNSVIDKQNETLLNEDSYLFDYGDWINTATESQKGNAYTVVDGFNTTTLPAAGKTSIELIIRPSSSTSGLFSFAIMQDANNYIEVQINRFETKIIQEVIGARTTLTTIANTLPVAVVRNNVEKVFFNFGIGQGTDDFVVIAKSNIFNISYSFASPISQADLTLIGGKQIGVTSPMLYKLYQ